MMLLTITHFKKMIETLEKLLVDAAKRRETLTYKQVAQLLELQPPNTIHQATECLEALMRQHAKSQTPQLASLVISRARGGLPAPGFFMLLHDIGLYNGQVDGEDARDFHAQEKERCFEFARQV
mgnify:CR=1 FL=1